MSLWQGLHLRRRRERGGELKPPESLGYAVRCLPWIEPPDRTGHLVCTACPTRLERDPNCSDLAILTLHWMSDHPEQWAAMHPESAEFLPLPRHPKQEDPEEGTR